ncbi:MAG: hypothetical protein CMG04_10525 [Candidatus Marinimicrobia bacterium]|nr:hypothetical protein [Candidatus Neomarinimicrobiota bacterium]|tara:strand:+ start:110 stop:997 length:888 start_codon:yes stop_codon:yes gene_type:complete
MKINFNSGDMYALLTAFCWSSAVILFDLSGRRLGAMQINLLKNAIGVMGFSLTLFVMGTGFPDFSMSEFLLLMYSGIVGIVIGDLFFLYSLKKIGSGLSAIISTIYSPAVFVISYYMFNDIISMKMILGGGFIIVAIVVGSKKIEKIKNKKIFMSGVLYGVIAQILTAYSVLLVKPIMLSHSVVEIALVRFGWALVSTVLVLNFWKGKNYIVQTIFKGVNNYFVIAGAFLGTYLSVIFWLAGFKYTTPARAAIYNQLSTILIMMMATLFLGEEMSKRKWGAVALAIFGALLISTQ